MRSQPVKVPHCPQCRSVNLRNTRPTTAGLYRVCDGCNHMWHEPREVARKKAAPRRVADRAV